MDVVGGMLLADGKEAKILTGIDDHSRFVVCAGLMSRATSRAVCAHFADAMRAYGVPQEVLTDNGKVFTGRFGSRHVEVLFDRICRENGIDHLLTAPRSPTTTGKIERFHRTLRQEFLTGRVFDDLADAQAELDAWVDAYNRERPHSALGHGHPGIPVRHRPRRAAARRRLGAGPVDRSGDDWITRQVAANGIISVAWQEISRRQAPRRAPVDIHVEGATPADLGRRRAPQDGAAHQREGGPQEALRAPQDRLNRPKTCNGSGEANPSRIRRTLTGPQLRRATYSSVKAILLSSDCAQVRSGVADGSSRNAAAMPAGAALRDRGPRRRVPGSATPPRSQLLKPSATVRPQSIGVSLSRLPEVQERRDVADDRLGHALVEDRREGQAGRGAPAC